MTTIRRARVRGNAWVMVVTSNWAWILRNTSRCRIRRHPLNSRPSSKRLEFVSREYAPVPGKWFENKEEDETFRVLSVDEDDELVEIEYLDGEIEELDLDTWHELDLNRPKNRKAGPTTRMRTTTKKRTRTSTTTRMKTTTTTTMKTTTSKTKTKRATSQ